MTLIFVARRASSVTPIANTARFAKGKTVEAGGTIAVFITKERTTQWTTAPRRPRRIEGQALVTEVTVARWTSTSGHNVVASVALIVYYWCAAVRAQLAQRVKEIDLSLVGNVVHLLQ